MKLFLTTLLLSSMSAPAFAQVAHDYVIDGDLSVKCAEAVVNRLVKDDSTGMYIEDENENAISLEWYDEEKTQVSFTLNFTDDVRDGYLTGEIAVKLKKNGTCSVGEVVRADIGD